MKLESKAGVCYNGKIFFSAFNCNGLFSVDISSGEIQFVKVFPDKKMIGLHRMAVLHENNGWFIPENGDYITRVNFDTMEMQAYSTKSMQNRIPNLMMFTQGIIIQNDMLYCLSTSIDSMISINMRTLEIKEISLPVDYEIPHYYYGAEINQKLYIFSDFFNKCTEYDEEHGIWKNNRLLSANGHFSYFCVSEDKVYLSPGTDSKFMSIDVKTGNKKVFTYESKQYEYFGSDIWDGKVIFLPFQSKSILAIDSNNNAYNEVSFKDNDIIEDGEQIISSFGCWDGDLVLSVMNTGWIVCCSQNKDWRYISLDVNDPGEIEKIQSAYDENGLMYVDWDMREDGLRNLGWLIKQINK